MRLTYGSTFSGIGGLDLAVERVFGARPLWHVEPEPYAAAVLRRHWPGVPNLHRIEWINDRTPSPDIIVGGFPCQDISTAGKGAGLSGERSGLWWELARAIRLLRPRLVILENVAALLTRGLVDVLGALARLGFDAEWGTLRASDVGAPHRRNRIFIVAAQVPISDADGHYVWQERQREGAHGAAPALAGRAGSKLVDTDGPRWQELRIPTSGPAGRAEPADPGRAPVGHPNERRRGDDGQPGLRHPGAQRGHDPHGRDGAAPWPPAPGDQGGWARWAGALPGVRRGAYGDVRGLDARRRRARLRGLGNGVVPSQAEAAIRELLERVITASEPQP